jgi:hypothetical protein
MPSCQFAVICLPLVRKLGQHAIRTSEAVQLPLAGPLISRSPMHESIEPTSTGKPSHSTIHTLNDDELLHIFYLFRLHIQDEEWNQIRFVLHWKRQRWWYKLAQVCQRWRSIIFASPSRLDLHLLCTYGTPVADMLTHSPPLPLTIYYPDKYRKMTKKDEKCILLALQHRDRVRHIMLAFRTSSWQKVITAMDEQFPTLERMRIEVPIHGSARLVLPSTFQAPLLRSFTLANVILPIGSTLLMTTVGLVTLILDDIPSVYFAPSHLLTRLSLMPHLEKLVVRFYTPTPRVEPQLSSTSVMTHITLPNLRIFIFRGVSPYLDALLAWIAAPLLNNFDISISKQPPFVVPHLLRFMRTTQNFDLSAIELNFSIYGFLLIKDLRSHSLFCMRINSGPLDLQVSSAVEILTTLEPVLSVVETLVLNHLEFYNEPSGWHKDVDRTLWRDLLRLFSNVNLLHVHHVLVREITRSLHPDNEEMPLDILPNLKDFQYEGESNIDYAFMPFIKDRQATRHPVTLSKIDGSPRTFGSMSHFE